MPTTPRLPVPPLDDTCERYLRQLHPLLSPEAFARTERLTRRFQHGSGRELQAVLQAFDAEAAERGNSWLAEAWLDAYLDTRDPLPLASNIGLRIPMHGHDLAQWLSALAAVHADYLHGRFAFPRGRDGSLTSTRQWKILQGAMREPRPHRDGYHLAAPGTTRHIGILYRGFYHRVEALDEKAEAHHPAHFRAAIERIFSCGEDNPWPIAVPCYLGSDDGARTLAALASHPDNARLLDEIRNDLFHLCLRNQPMTADAELAASTFVPTQDIWCLKALSYVYNRATDSFFLHAEHSWEDGGTLKGILERALRRLQTPDAGADERPARRGAESPAAVASGSLEGHDEGAESLSTSGDAAAPSQSALAAQAPAPEARAWTLTEAQKRRWSQCFEAYAARARSMGLQSRLLPVATETLPGTISQDALMQFLLQYAQLAVYGSVRNTYEAVDVSHFQAGRTECVRPVSDESVAFVRGLQQGKPDRACFEAALAEHKARIKDCKQGLGPNRHLLGLLLMSKRLQQPTPAFFRDEGYRCFCTDFLSTSTIGDDSITGNIGFAPTSADGLGVYYAPTRQGWWFTISHRASQQAEVDAFLDALQEGATRLYDWVMQEAR